MADIELVIKIPEEVKQTFDNAKNENLYANYYDRNSLIGKAIQNGIPLPKGHGRILDEKDILDTENNDGGWYDLVDMPEYIAGVKTIIEADKERSE